jgi:cytokinesis protein
MDSIFGRKSRKVEQRPRQVSAGLDERSVPYDRMAPGRAPVPISAPITNPTLTASGTQMNLHAMQRARSERDKTYQLSRSRADSPGGPTTDGDSSAPTSVAPSVDGTPGSATASPRSSATPGGRRTRQSNSSTTSGRTDSRHPRTPSMSDFGSIPSPTLAGRGTVSPMTPHRPSSASTVARSENRNSRYAPSEFSTESASSNYHALARQLRRGDGETFIFERPTDDSQIEALYENLLQNREIKDLNHVDIDHKWMMVFSAEQLRWQQEREARRASEREARRNGNDNGVDAVAAANIDNTPEFFMKKFLDKTITVKQAQSLEVSLRSGEVTCVCIRFCLLE